MKCRRLVDSLAEGLELRKTAPVLLRISNLRTFSSTLLPQVSGELQAGQFFRGGELVADLAFGDFAQSGVFGGKFFQRLDEGATAAAELLHAARDDVDQNVGVVDDLAGGGQVIVSHVFRWIGSAGGDSGRPVAVVSFWLIRGILKPPRREHDVYLRASGVASAKGLRGHALSAA